MGKGGEGKEGVGKNIDKSKRFEHVSAPDFGLRTCYLPKLINIFLAEKIN